ncbi:probetacellulin-like [Haliotis asinina]|uniref:probetacellulin-like n=1 Tax=Haliotis asinina TaxID=109174 RepID=UPI003531BA04
MLHPLILAIALGPSLQGIVDACGRIPGKPTTPTPVPDTTTEAFSHRKPCTDSEKHKKGCLQNGECFAISLGGNRTLSCKCPEMFTGQRCEEISPDIFKKLKEEEQVVTASIAAGVSVLIISLTMGIIYAVVKVKRRRNRQETRLNGVPKNGNLLRPINENDSPDEGDESIQEDEKKQTLLYNNHLLNDIHNCNRETNV